MLLPELEKIGLNKKQAKIYMACLELGETTVLELAKFTGFNRTTVYKIVDELLERKIISISIKGKKKFFVAESPEKLSVLIKESLASFNSVIPELSSLMNKNKVKPVLKYFEGVEGIERVYKRTLLAKEKILKGFVGVEAITTKSKSLQWFWEKDYIPKRKKKDVFVKLVVPDNKIGRAFKEKDKSSGRESRLVPASFYNFECEVHCYDNVVGFISYSQGEEFALIIESKPIANTLKMVWQMCWNMGY